MGVLFWSRVEVFAPVRFGRFDIRRPLLGGAFVGVTHGTFSFGLPRAGLLRLTPNGFFSLQALTPTPVAFFFEAEVTGSIESSELCPAGVQRAPVSEVFCNAGQLGTARPS